MTWRISAASVLLTIAASYSQTALPPEVQSIFATRCSPCHGPQRQMGGLSLDDPTRAASVTDKLLERVTSKDPSFRMPLGGQPLSDAQIAALRSWAATAASAPAASKRSALWSFQPLARPAPPAVRSASWTRNEIDRFILARLERENLKPSPEADRRTLIRRLSLDLIGLPPTPAEVAAFEADHRPDAYERLVDRLLASPHFGEKWARPWLDLAHYADSDGYEKDLTRPWSWRYRQWVIDALNRDLPYDEFTIEQIAGDLLPGATVEQRVATGFLRNTLTNREAGVDRAEARFEQIINRTNTVGTVWLGLTVGCAQCHNHKFDPIPQRDYYSLFAFMNSTEEEDIEAPLPGQLDDYLMAKPAYDGARYAILMKAGEPRLQAIWERRIREAFKDQGKDLEWDFAVTEMRGAFDSAEKFLRGYWTNRTRRQTDDLTDYFLTHLGPDFEKDPAVPKQLKIVRDQLDVLKKALPEIALASVVHTDPVPEPSHIHVGGDYNAEGDAVEPATLSALPPMPPGAKPDRLALARWLVSPANPLTARVAVNRMWQEFFGAGLVSTSEDFGTQGEKPTHPALLDWLACEFRDRGWSMKRMHKLIVMSAAYRQSSNVSKELAERDPANSLIARQTRVRLPAESIRDEALSVSGLLNPAIGGKSVRPPQPAGIAELGYAGSVKWPETPGPGRYRRGLYIHFQRTTPYPMLVNFDAPDSNASCTRRRRSDTPLQALNLLNDPVFFEAAQALAGRVLLEAPSSADARLDYAFQLCLGRKPTARERQILTSAQFAGADETARFVDIARVLLNLDEFITRE